MKFFDELKWRGVIKDISSEELEDKLNNDSLTFYLGTDPTADSLHLGHLSSFLISKRLKDYGHNPILLVGGGTGLIGDPRPTAERDTIVKEELFKNTECLKNQVQRLFGFKVVNNYDWIKDISAIDFLRDYGKHFNVNYMINKDIVRRRLESGITYCEMSYMILQSLDFLHLNKEYGCTLQVAGSDQWGNITAGIELIRKKTDKTAYGMVMPLVTDSNGVKFGKTEGNALWLDKNKTSSYELYQYLVNLEDTMIISYLKKLTFLSKEEIEEIEAKHNEHPELREAHKILAREIITDLHGKDEYEKAVRISEALFKGNFSDLSNEELGEAFKGNEVKEIEINKNILDVLVEMNVATSKRQAREFISGNSIEIKGEKVKDLDKTITEQDLINDIYLIIKRGKKNYYIGKICIDK